MTDATDINNLDPVIPTHVPANDPMEIIDSRWGRMERWRAATLATGMVGPIMEIYEAVRADAADATRRADATEARKALVQRLCDQVAALQARVNVLADELEARQRADAEEEEAERIQAQLDALPDPDDPDPLGHRNTGDLSPTDMGGVPLSYKKIPTSYVHSEEPELEHPPVVPQPVAIGFDKE